MHYNESGEDFAAPSNLHHRIATTAGATTISTATTKTMALNIPMLIASGQTLDNWNTAGQYSPPIGSGAGGVSNSQQQQQLRVPLSYGGGGGSATPYPGGGGGGGGSSSSEFQPSPHKTIDTSDNEDNNNRDEATAAALGQLAAKVERRTPSGLAAPGGGSLDVGVAVEPGGETVQVPTAAAASGSHSEGGSSPIPNTNANPNGGGRTTPTTNMHEAHKQQHPHPHPHSHPHPHHHLHSHLLQTSPVSVRAATPRQAHEQLPHHHHAPHGHHADELDIKQELVDYFHGTSAAAGVGVGAGQQAGPPPLPLDSQRSYSSAGEESRSLQLDMAQDLRVAQAKAQVNFGGFVLPPRSNSAQLAAAAAMPLNMRKLSSNAGQLLMSSLMRSRESMSEDGDADNDEATESAASPGHIKSSVSAQDASSAVQAAAALYAESLSRDDCDFVGSNVSMKLRTMDRTQRIIAEKLISEVLYFGQFNELERTARIQPK
ncbi:histone-lysine N-methyltransferase Suv4-20 isoform X1 [Drosophila sulfurigaster albostrigata]|uniref:histone-lysine N-methyltransferase Suv4-20 isoform X1 n=1 Tax=Drosophila sulfurigaster albostrigata TaxID=89887 RepID=UPI002D21A501|nr:histone-lysine N-methyltransferase Suv4-20 isoform X1 [Drosophila sulfurigaster albostrigata]